MSFSRPVWLLALCAVAIVVWIARRGSSPVSPRQSRAALWVRVGLLSLIVMSAAGATLTLPERRIATVFVVDVSDSVGDNARATAERFVIDAIRLKPKSALAGVVMAGGDARVEATVQESPGTISFATEPDGTRTDLARALRLGAALLPEGTRRRIVLLSDGRENRGDARAEALRLRRQGIRVDVVAMKVVSGPDAGIQEVRVPSRVRQGEVFDVVVQISSSAVGRAQLETRRGTELVDERTIDLVAGQQEVTVAQTADAPGAVTYRATLKPERDSTFQNDSASGVVLVQGLPRVLIIEGEPAEGAVLADALSSRGIAVTRRGASAFPSAEELAGVDSVVMVDVDAAMLTEIQQRALEAFVRQLGHGLVAVGGESSWSLGDYRNSVLESLLPLTSDIKDPKRRPSIAQALVVDTSGSMSGPKIEIAKVAASKAFSALTPEDEAGLLAFNTNSAWILPVAKVPSSNEINRALGTLTANGGTEIPQAIYAAIEGLKGSKSSLKHIILFSDGFNGSGDMISAAQEAVKQGITLSVVGTGESAAGELERIAGAGNGRFYPGRDLDRIPEVIMNEVIIASRKYVNEGSFIPKVTGSSAATARLTASPPLLGYIGTSSKPSASVLLAVGEFDDPLLATWRTGLGVATAWTSDAKARWSQPWLGWEGFADFWSEVVKETMPGTPDPRFSSRVVASEEGIEVVIESEETIPEGVQGRASFVDPSGNELTFDLRRTGVASFTGAVSAGSPGAYLGNVSLSSAGATLFSDGVAVVRSFSAEYRAAPADPELMKKIASTTRGRVNVTPAAVFRTDMPLGRRRVDLSRWLLLIAALVLPIDIALRRLILTKQDLETLRGRLFKRTLQVDGSSATVRRRLLDAKQRADRASRPSSALPQMQPSVRPAPETSEAEVPSATVSQLLKKKRERQG